MPTVRFVKEKLEVVVEEGELELLHGRAAYVAGAGRASAAIAYTAARDERVRVRAPRKAPTPPDA